MTAITRAWLPCATGLLVATIAAAQPGASTSSAASAATVREFKHVFRTYPFSDPDPNPAFGRIYPYFRYDGYTNQAEDREWTVVELENAWLKVWVLPEIGGKVWTAIEKSTGKPFIYENHVVKFRDIAMRGPWTSGGIEANYGILGHTPNCATPVDYVTRATPDGTASVVIGALDLLTRTSWRLEIALPANAAYFTTRSLWQNASSLEQPYYTWMNAGIKAAGNLEFVYPGTHYLGHNGDAGAWPIHPANGKNLAFYEQNDFGPYKSYHVFGEYTDFFGAYWHDDDFGMGRYARRSDKVGKKIWIWGLSPQGMIWEKLLTDSDGQYVEVQSGRLFNQTAPLSSETPFKHRGFTPGATDTWTEYWFPVKGTKGIVQANDVGALNVRAGAGRLDLAFSPLVRIDADLEVYDGDTRIHTTTLALAPLQTWTATVPVNVDPKRLRVRIGERFSWSGNREEARLSRPVEAPSDFNRQSTYGRHLAGRELIRQRQYREAEIAIDDALRSDPNFVPALADKALLRYRAADDEAAFVAARRALSVDTYDPAANYYYGLAAARLGRRADARDGFDVAAQSVEYRSAALIELSRLAVRARDLAEAGAYVRQAMNANGLDLEARQLDAVVSRLRGDAAAARSAIDGLLAIDPLNHVARFERYLADRTASQRLAFTSGLRGEMPHETCLEIAIWYQGAGLDDEARAVLELSPARAEVIYWRAYLDRARNPAWASTLAVAAEAASPRLVFPFRRESVPVFEWAVSRGRGWKPRYYLALLMRALGNDARAATLLAEAGNDPDFAPFYVLRALIASSSDRGLADLQRAAALDPADWRIVRRLTERAIADGRIDDAVSLASTYHQAHPGHYIIGMLRARTLLLAGRPADALELLKRIEVLPYEGSTDGRVLHREASLTLAVAALGDGHVDEAERFIATARVWPVNLGAGKPYDADVDERLEDWLLAEVLDARGARNEAAAARTRLVASNGARGGVGGLVTALALRALNRGAEADQVASVVTASEGAFANWAVQVLRGERPAAPAGINDDGVRVLAAYFARASR